MLNISGVPCLASASFKASTQNSASMLLDSRHAKDLATVPVHDGNKVQEAPPHWDIGDVRAPDLVRTVNHDVPQQIRPDFMLRVLFAGIGLLVDWNQPHETHQSPDTMATTLVIIALHVPRHLA